MLIKYCRIALTDNMPHERPCKTSQPPHTAFRGFGGPQGMIVTEHVIEHLAHKCKVSPDKLRRDVSIT